MLANRAAASGVICARSDARLGRTVLLIQHMNDTPRYFADHGHSTDTENTQNIMSGTYDITYRMQLEIRAKAAAQRVDVGSVGYWDRA